MKFEVWAPHARGVELCLKTGERHIMEPTSPAGWWSIDIRGLSGEIRYGFSIDGDVPLPDPRARRMPDGVHALSGIWDASSFEWTDRGFRAAPLSSGLIYELHVGTFSEEGSFDGVITKLDHLVGLGVTHVELMPVNSFPGAFGWGYDGVGLFSVFEPYGGPDGLCRLVDACHRRGLAVLIDVVYNHLGPEGNYLARYGPYFTDRYETPWGAAVNLDDRGSDEVRRFFLDNAKMWVRDFHADGLRIDAIHALADGSAKHLLEEMAEEFESLQAEVARPLVLVAESDLNDPRVIQRRQAGGFGMDAQWTDDFHHAVHALMTGERQGYYADFGTWAEVAKSLESAFVVDGVPSRFRGRRHGRSVGTLTGHRFVVYTQTHDQVGNRATGDRLGHQLSEGRLKMALALLLMSPFVPMLFMGEEWAASSPFQFFCDFGDPSLREAVKEGRKKEFEAFDWNIESLPDPLSPETFGRCRLNWGELQEAGHRRVLEWVRELVRLRRSYPELTDGARGRSKVRFGPHWLTMRRGRVSLAVNTGVDELGFSDLPGDVLLAHAGERRSDDGDVVVGPDGVVIVADST
ncbi:MAG: malto-oligosyltrehalose trehalohydrolase [Myxococcota bacterium]